MGNIFADCVRGLSTSSFLKWAVSICIGSLSVYLATYLSAVENSVTVSGVVVDADSGRPLPNITVAVDTARDRLHQRGSTLQTASGPGITATDTLGRFKLSGIKPGARLLAAFPATARGPLFATSLPLKVKPGVDISDLAIRLHMPASIEGTVYNHSGFPAKDVRVLLITPEMSQGLTRYFIKAVSRTAEDGRYKFDDIRSDLPWAIMVDPTKLLLSAASGVSKDPDERTQIPKATFYPNVTEVSASTLITLLSGEMRNGIDVTLTIGRSYCIDGAVSGSDIGLSAEFQLTRIDPSYGSSTSKGFWGPSPKVRTESNGSFRICGVTDGEYNIVSFTRDADSADAKRLGSVPIRVSNQDVRNLHVRLSLPLTIDGETKWAPELSPKKIPRPVPITLFPVGRSPWISESRPAIADVPGAFKLPFVFQDHYKIKVGPLPRGYFVSQMQFGSKQTRGDSILVDTRDEMGKLIVMVEGGAGSMHVRAVDDKSRPMSGSFLYVIPKDATDLAAISREAIIGQCDQDGEHFFDQVLRPREYVVVATTERPRSDTDFWLHLWSLRNRGSEVTISQSSAISLETRVVR